MKRWLSLVAGILFLAVPVLLTAEQASGQEVMNELDPFNRETVLEFDIMVGVAGPFQGAANPIRGINGGGRPWVLDEGEGKLETDGRLNVKVRGLIIPATEPGFGFNPAAFFLAAVSCLTTDGNGNVVTENVFTVQDDTKMRGDPRDGDADIRAMLILPTPCVAPIIFVTSPTGSWFSATGF